MKDEILKIILDSSCECTACKKETAAEIEDHAMEFSKWVADNISVDWDDEMYSYYPFAGGERYFKGISDIYRFWEEHAKNKFVNIKNKL